MSDLAVKLEGISKCYQLGGSAHGTLYESVERILRPGKFKDQELPKKDFWALKDVSFEIKKGEVVGIIGRNGAGKSTMLKILSRITKPTAGKAELNGRVASLLEVGTGFHPELTGRENIYLNGSILGMKRSEIKAKFEEIVAFSGVEKFLDTPVKRYSSGMYVRLAFAVAAHLEPEILIIDEVLAVGDAEFQKKCLGKMKEVAGEGRTVLFVSHNLDTLSRLVSKAMLLTAGVLEIYDKKDIVIGKYLSEGSHKKLKYEIGIIPDLPHIKEISVLTTHPANSQENGKKLSVLVSYFLPFNITKTCITLAFRDERHISCLDISFFDNDGSGSTKGYHQILYEIPSIRLYMGKYTLDAYFAEPPGGHFFERLESAVSLEVFMNDKSRGDWEWSPYSTTYIETYNVNKINNG